MCIVYARWAVYKLTAMAPHTKIHFNHTVHTPTHAHYRNVNIIKIAAVMIITIIVCPVIEIA